MNGCMKMIQKPMYNYSGIVLWIQLDVNWVHKWKSWLTGHFFKVWILISWFFNVQEAF